jgi:hypothetical protein
MTIRIVRLGTERSREEGLRIGTVRRPPWGVPKKDYAFQKVSLRATRRQKRPTCFYNGDSAALAGTRVRDPS